MSGILDDTGILAGIGLKDFESAHVGKHGPAWVCVKVAQFFVKHCMLDDLLEGRLLMWLKIAKGARDIALNCCQECHLGHTSGFHITTSDVNHCAYWFYLHFPCRFVTTFFHNGRNMLYQLAFFGDTFADDTHHFSR